MFKKNNCVLPKFSTRASSCPRTYDCRSQPYVQTAFLHTSSRRIGGVEVSKCKVLVITCHDGTCGVGVQLCIFIYPSTRWGWVDSITPRPIYARKRDPYSLYSPKGFTTREAAPRGPLKRTLGSLHFLPGVEPRFIGLAGRSLINIPIALPRFLPQEL